MRIHELDKDDLRTDEGLASWLVKTGAKLGGRQAVKAGLKAAPTATKLGSKAVQTAAKSKGFFGVFGEVIGGIVKLFITLGFGYSVAKPIYDYHKNIGKLEDMLSANEISQEEYQYQRQQLMGLMITKIAVVVETAAILGSIAGVLKVFKILLHYVPFAGKSLGWIITTITAMDATAAAGAILAINSKWGSEWITKIAFYHLSDIFPSLKGSQWDLDIADVLGSAGTFIVDEFKDHVLGGRDPKDKPIQGNTPAEKAGKTPSQQAADAAVAQQADNQTKDTDQWDQIGPGREQNRRTGVIRMNDKY